MIRGFFIYLVFVFSKVFVDRIYIGLFKRRNVELMVPEGQVCHTLGNTKQSNILFFMPLGHKVVLNVT